MAGHRGLLFFLLGVALSSCNDMGKPGQPCSGWFQNIKNGHCYRKFCDYQTFDDAQSICKEHGGHLPYIRNEQENKFVATLARSGTITMKPWGFESLQNHWIGIRLQEGPNGERKTWRFLDDDRTEAKYFAWQPLEPNNAVGKEFCVHYAPLFGDWVKWNDMRCDDKVYTTYICERDSCVF